MKKRFAGVIFSLVLATSISATPIGLLYTSAKEPLVVNADVLGSKKAVGVLTHLIGFGFGDASIEKIAKEAGIKKITHIDKETTYVLLGLYATETYYVYGD